MKLILKSVFFGKETSYSPEQLTFLFAITDESNRQEILKKYSNIEEIHKVYSQHYKYNMQPNSNSLLLQDVRNFKNFRATYDTYYKEGEPAKNDIFNPFKNFNNNGGTNPSKSYYMSNADFLFSDSFTELSTTPFKPEVQPIILNEFQPDELIYLQKLIASSLKSITSTIGGAKKPDKFSFKKVLKNLFVDTLGAARRTCWRLYVKCFITSIFIIS